MITFDEFYELYLDLSMSERIAIYNKYCDKYDGENKIEENEGYALAEYFTDIWDALRAAQYGEYDVNDEYFVVNSYGNLDSFFDTGAMEIINSYIESIYEDVSLWKDYIEPGCENDEDE